MFRFVFLCYIRLVAFSGLSLPLQEMLKPLPLDGIVISRPFLAVRLSIAENLQRWQSCKLEPVLSEASMYILVQSRLMQAYL